MPALIRKAHEAKRTGARELVIWARARPGASSCTSMIAPTRWCS